MKIAITSTGGTIESNLDARFGRCSHFAIYDTESGVTEFFSNPNKESLEGAGPASVQFVACRDVEKVISGEFGGKVKSIFETLKIQMVTMEDNTKTIGEILDLKYKM